MLAHTLGALSIQLTAIDTLARNNAPREKLITQIELGHELVSTGLDEARQAVRALRGENAPPAAQLERLCELHQAELELDGGWQELEADTTLTLYPLAAARLIHASRRNDPGHPGKDASLPDGLTEREGQVLGLIAQGLSNAEIAARLYLSRSTVKTHINQIFTKTGSRDRPQAIVYAHRHAIHTEDSR